MPGFLERLRIEKEIRDAQSQRFAEAVSARREAELAARDAQAEQLRRNLEASRLLFDQTSFREITEELKGLVIGYNSIRTISMGRSDEEYPGAYGLEFEWNYRRSVSEQIETVSYDKFRILVVSEFQKIIGIGKKTHKEPVVRLMNSPLEQEKFIEKLHKSPQHFRYEDQVYNPGY